MPNQKETIEKDFSRNRGCVTAAELKKMCPQQRARYLAYEEPPKEVQKMVSAANQRLCARNKKAKKNQRSDEMEDLEKKRQNTLIGQLKAAEARNRIRHMRLRYQARRAEDINLMIASQPTALQAVRLEMLLPSKVSQLSGCDSLDTLEAKRPKVMQQRISALIRGYNLSSEKRGDESRRSWRTRRD